MIVDLPAPEMTMAGGMADIACQDLFVSELDVDEDDLDTTRGADFHRKDGFLAGDSKNHASVGGDFLRAPVEHFMYSSTSASESELELGDVLTSDIDQDTDAEQFQVELPVQAQDAFLASPSVLTEVLPLTESPRSVLAELSFNSPGELTGTPCDMARRYEYPYPPPDEDDLPPSTGLGMEFLPTPQLSPETETPDPFLRYTSNMNLIPPAPLPIAFALMAATASGTGVALGPLLPAPATITHPKLARFNLANVPIPPTLRERIARMPGYFPALRSSSSKFEERVANVVMSAAFPLETPTTPRAAYL